jgi:hypothetical protein
MRSNFVAAGKNAMGQIRVPELSMEMIRTRSREASRRDRIRALLLYGVLSVSLVGAGSGLAAKLYDGVRVWFFGSKVAVVVTSLVVQQEPTASDLQAIVRRATFPVVLPVDMPPGMRITRIMYAPFDHPTSITIVYRNDRTNSRMTVSLFDHETITNGTTGLPSRPWIRARSNCCIWTIDRETVVMMWPTKYAKVIDTIKTAMMKTSPQGSMIATEPMLRNIIVEGGPDAVADIVEQYAPVRYGDALLDGKYIGWIHWLAKNGKAGPDSRTAILTEIPTTKNGAPDYYKAKVNWPDKIISKEGVAAIQAFLRATHTGPNCHCELLYYRSNTAAYAIWRIPVTAPHSVEKYVVDAKTLAVRRL